MVASKLNFDKKKLYNLTIEITDGNHQTHANVVIDILPMITKRPQFKEEEIKAEVNENEAIGHIITKIKVIDNNDGKVDFAFHTAQNPLSLKLFKIHPVTGEVSLREKLDMERMRQHVLVVVIKVCTDTFLSNYSKKTNFLERFVLFYNIIYLRIIN